MERITLANLHVQLDSIRSTSIPQVKRYFRKRIVKCINECKSQAMNMKKSIESTSTNSQQLNPNDYEFGWGSDFDEEDDDEEDEDHGEQYNQICDNRSGHLNNVQSLSNLRLDESNTEKQRLSHSISLHSFNEIHQASSSKGSCLQLSMGESNVRRPISEPPPPPLPKEPPPNVSEEEEGANHRLKKSLGTGVSEDAYEIMTIFENSCDDEYLLPNSGPISESYVSASDKPLNNYEYIQYNQMDRDATNSSDSGSILSSTSRNSRNSRTNSKYESEVNNDRPLPPIPKEDSFNEMMLSSFTWFHDLERDQAESILKQMGEDGVYLVRKSRRAGASNPYTLTLYHSKKVFHLNVRKRSDGLFALGKEKYKEKTFASVVELVEHHNIEPIFLTSKGQAAGKTRLIYTPSMKCEQS
ncbi:hypothetical protein RDWZM_000721 [Blomia tropicalis]|uniref:SH2 domain-containing protein n=1 Tax=Blomia tropicalis TaxID=40697 RepID=A0A9Q0RQR1_BLOTA|nr:hypothetical protein RDWZM_000721 [Blomia tropicalis]